LGVELARRAGSSKSAVTNAVKRGSLKKETNGLFDTTEISVKDFISKKNTPRRTHLSVNDQSPFESWVVIPLVKNLYARLLCIKKGGDESIIEPAALEILITEVFKDFVHYLFTG